MKNIIYLVSAILLFSCDANDFTNIPQDYSESSYDYNSNSSYYDDRGLLATNGTNRGSLDLFSSDETISVIIYPRLGWSYELTFDNIEEHTLSDGSTVTSFRIVRSAQYLSNAISYEDNEFRVNGTSAISLENDGSTLGTYDGLIYPDGSLQFEFESVNLKSGEFVVTTITGFPIY